MKIIDLTHTIHSAISVYPGTESPLIINTNTIAENGFAEKHLSMVSHTGTHMDAPCHIIEGGKSLDQFPVEQFIGKCIVVAVDAPAQIIISLAYLKKSEERIRKADFLLFKSGWSAKWMTDSYFEGFPVLSTEAASWLTGFHLKGIGLDSISIDPVGDDALENHRIVLSAEIFIIENLANLDLLPEDEFFDFYCLPLKIEDADGAPVRAVALLDEQD